MASTKVASFSSKTRPFASSPIAENENENVTQSSPTENAVAQHSTTPISNSSPQNLLSPNSYLLAPATSVSNTSTSVSSSIPSVSVSAFENLNVNGDDDKDSTSPMIGCVKVGKSCGNITVSENLLVQVAISKSPSQRSKSRTLLPKAKEDEIPS